MDVKRLSHGIMFQLRTKIQSYMDSFQSMSTFLETFRAQPAAITRELLLLAEEGLLGLYFECDQEFISSTVKLCISVYVVHWCDHMLTISMVYML